MTPEKQLIQHGFASPTTAAPKLNKLPAAWFHGELGATVSERQLLYWRISDYCYCLAGMTTVIEAMAKAYAALCAMEHSMCQEAKRLTNGKYEFAPDVLHANSPTPIWPAGYTKWLKNRQK